MANTETVATKIVIPCRFSYANVFVARAAEEGGEKKFGSQILIPKKDKATVKKVKDAIAAAKAEGLAGVFKGKFPPNMKMCLRDGDEEKPDDEVYAGHYFFSANSKQKPGCVDADLNPIIDPSEFYSGCYGRAALNFYAFNKKGAGIACGLNNVQKLKDSEPLGSRSSASADFGGEDNGSDDDL